MEVNPEYSLEVLMLKLKLQYFGHLTWRTDSLEKTLILGKIEDRSRGQQRMRWLNAITDWWVWASSRSWWWTGKPGLLHFMRLQRIGHIWMTELNWFWFMAILMGNAKWNFCISVWSSAHNSSSTKLSKFSYYASPPIMDHKHTWWNNFDQSFRFISYI